MNCSKGECRYCTEEKLCKVDNKLCDIEIRPGFRAGAIEYHCRQDQKEELRGISADCALMPNAPLMPFWSCENICKYYDICLEE